MAPSGPTDRELIEAVEPAVGTSITTLSRRPFEYATSVPLEELTVTLDDGRHLTMILKDLDPGRRLPEAGRHKPRFLDEPRRPIETYRAILAPAGIGPRCYATTCEPAHSRYWLVLEKVSGPVLWQVGEFAVWEETAGWLGRFHAAFADRVEEVRTANPYLLDLGPDWLRKWRHRAAEALGRRKEPRARELIDRLDAHEELVEALGRRPSTLLHGEFYPSNVLVETDPTPPRICPVDWEMAGTGPGLFDLAALCGGWDEVQRTALLTAYRAGLRAAGAELPPIADDEHDLDRCRLHLALQWLGWADGWQAPPEHARDWEAEARAISARLGW